MPDVKKCTVNPGYVSASIWSLTLFNRSNAGVARQKIGVHDVPGQLLGDLIMKTGNAYHSDEDLVHTVTGHTKTTWAYLLW